LPLSSGQFSIQAVFTAWDKEEVPETLMAMKDLAASGWNEEEGKGQLENNTIII